MSTETERERHWLDLWREAEDAEHGDGCETVLAFARAVASEAARAAPAVPAWQDIATAPMDGTAVLVMRDIWPGTDSGRAEECNGHNTYVAAWWAGERGGAGAWICYMDAVHDPECPVEPTHWMPLPLPPHAEGGRDGTEGVRVHGEGQR